MKKRARGKEEKEARRDSILRAAEVLWEEKTEREGASASEEDKGLHLPSVAEVAEVAGLSKGTLYLYFQTKEEIYLALLEEHLHRWLGMIQEGIEGFDAKRGSEAERRERMAEILLGYALERRAFLRLAGLSTTVLEQNLSPERALSYKRGLAEGLEEVGGGLEEVLPLAEGEGKELLLASYALIVGLWPMIEPPPAIEMHLQREELAVFRKEEKKTLRDALWSLWRGWASRTKKEDER